MVHQSKFFYKPDFYKDFLALVDFGVDINYVYEGLIPTIYFEKTYQGAVSENSKLLAIHSKFQMYTFVIKMFVTRLLFYLSKT